MNEEHLEQEFRQRLLALLAEYNATMSAADHWTGYAECGQDIRITVYIPSVYDCGEIVRYSTDIDLGQYIGD